MFRSSIGKEESIRASKVISPQNAANKPSNNMFDEIYIPPPLKQESLKISISEFITQLRNQIRRINPNFDFEYSSEPPLLQTLSYITQAIDYFLEENINLSNTIPASPSILEENLNKNYIKIKADIEKAKETTKNLNRYEQLLRQKEGKLEKQKNELKIAQKKLKEAEEDILKTREKFELQETNFNKNQKKEKEELDLERENLENKILEFRDMKERFEKRMEDATKYLTYEKERLSCLENMISENKTILISEQKTLSSERMELEKLKWDLEQKERKIEEANSLILVRQANLQEEYGRLVLERENILELKSQLEEDKLYTENLKDSQKIPSAEPLRRSADNENELEIGQACEELENQVEKINKELDQRESELEEREMNILILEKDICLKADKLQKIEIGLTESKIYCEELKTQTFSDIEALVQEIQVLFREIYEKKHELDIYILRVTKEIEFLQRYKSKLDVIYGSKEVKLEDSDYKNEDVRKIALELEEKLKVVNSKSDELAAEEFRLENEKAANIKNAELLKRTHIEIENTRVIMEKKISEDRRELAKQLQKIEERERKLLQGKEELEKREKAVKLKEEILKETRKL